MENKDIRYYAKVHSIESFGTVDGPRHSLCNLSARVSFAMQVLPQP